MKSRLPALATVVCVASLLLPAAALEAQIPDEFTNLQLLDPQGGKRELVSIMRDWATGLGVRCNHCHVGPDNLIGMDFASDDKATKRTARKMLEMSRILNRDLLAGLPVVADGERHQVVSCYTCHRGQAKPPRNIVAELESVAAEEGVDRALEHYDKLRAEHFGSGVYDFSPAALGSAASYLMQAGQAAEAIQTLEKSLEYSPDEADTHAMIGMVHLQRGDAGAARKALERALELDPENRSALRAMQMIAPSESSTPPAD